MFGAIVVGMVMLSLALDSSGQSALTEQSGTGDVGTAPLGLGIDRQTIIDLFDDDYAFTPPSETSGSETIVEGTTLLGQESIVLYGPSDNLTRILHAAVPEFVEPHEQGMQNLRRGILLMVLVPEWNDSSDWMSSQFHTLQDGESEGVDTAGKRITMDRMNHKGVSVYGLVIETID